MPVFNEPLEFEWDAGNRNKNKTLHGVSNEEAEESFFDPGKKVLRDASHSSDEERYLVIGKTKRERLLFVVFTMRDNKIRIISARDLNKRERYLYEEKPKSSKIQE